ncbi:MAG TPA: hypothetical protein VMU94_28940 [Streptosporangiaceae bacterium]|nr:hypothetical protein [Streptosporangiaceae bacterium]
MKHRLLLAISIFGMVLYGGSAAASAAVQTHASAGQQNCVATALPAGDPGTPSMTCYTSFAKAISAATDGRVHLPASAAPGSVTIRQLNAGAIPATVFVLSIDYVNDNFGGGSLTWTQSSACGRFQASSMPSGWNDTVSSVATYSGCANTLYKNIDFGGSTYSIGRNSSASSLGSFNDLTSSEKWCTAKPC